MKKTEVLPLQQEKSKKQKTKPKQNQNKILAFLLFRWSLSAGNIVVFTRYTMSTATAEDIMWSQSQRHEMVGWGWGWLDGTWGRVMGEFGGISSRRCEVFASFVPPPPCFLWTVAFFASVIRGYLLSHLRLLAVFLHVYPTHTHIVDCFGVERLLFWWAKGFFFWWWWWERLLETSHLCA